MLQVAEGRMHAQAVLRPPRVLWPVRAAEWSPVCSSRGRNKHREWTDACQTLSDALVGGRERCCSMRPPVQLHSLCGGVECGPWRET